MPLPCIRWGTLNSEGYGVIIIGQKQYRVHRLAYTEAYGTNPELDVGHICHDADLSCPGGKTCQHRACYEVTHLKSMTRRQNVQAGVHGRSVRCPQGHIRAHGQKCPECNRSALRTLYASRKAAGLSTAGTPYVRGPYKARKEG